MIRWILSILFFTALGEVARAEVSFNGSSGAEVLVVFNTRMPQSKEVAEHYARKRSVPSLQLLGLELPRSESISRQEFREKLKEPILHYLEKHHWISFLTNSLVNSNGVTNSLILTRASKIRYLVLIYGVPLKVLPEMDLQERGASSVSEKLRRNEAAVDSELAILPLVNLNLPLTGPLKNPLYTATNNLHVHPTNGLFIVARLDGPTADQARGLVDKALQAESDGLWGRAYFDQRNIQDSAYKIGDEWMAAASAFSTRYGFETIVDNQPETFPKSFPMSQIALYFGWYDQKISGPFTRETLEFMPGAVAYHLFSYSARSVREPENSWVATFIDKGVTATFGSVEEPYLIGTPDLSIFVPRFLAGFTFGEAAYVAQSTLSWQTTVIGDPLYRPFGKNPRELHENLIKKKSPLLEWSHLRVVNLNLVKNANLGEIIDYLEKEPLTKKSAVLWEKLGELYTKVGKPNSALYAYSQALKTRPTPEQEIRLALLLAKKFEELGKLQDALEVYKSFVRYNKQYADLDSIMEAQLSLAKRLDLDAEIRRIQKERNRPQEPRGP